MSKIKKWFRVTQVENIPLREVARFRLAAATLPSSIWATDSLPLKINVHIAAGRSPMALFRHYSCLSFACMES